MIKTRLLKNCKSKALAEMSGTNVVKCYHSGRIRWYFKNLMITFKEEDFLSFSESFANLEYEEKGWVTVEGNRIMEIKTCHREIRFMFNDEEYQQITALFERARLELEILEILSQ